ncbi:MAG TPA: transglycosylase SLT domain-containing protein [Candidatus Kryptonia bacterium]|nr:transglycosylase SLT domain-containing protein [Candidatus Kryptonia bacterium]
MSQRRRKRRGRRRSARWSWGLVTRHAVELVAILFAGLVAALAALGGAAERFTGIGLWSNLLPFAAAILAFALTTTVALTLWLAMRPWLLRRLSFAPMVLAIAVAGGAGWFANRPSFEQYLASLRMLVGGPAAAERTAIAHQVYAAYRRADATELQRMLNRLGRFEPVIREAATAFGVDPEVLIGIGAAESSYSPRDSADGGRGLFQITVPPATIVQVVQERLATDRLDSHDPRHNAFLAAATLRTYLDQMNGDLFLGLLAYNIGPHNGGLRAIMQQYGARDFVTIQPYLQHLPRDYPIRVLSAALAYRVWRVEGRLPHYEEGDNAARIQRIGIPGLVDESGAG